MASVFICRLLITQLNGKMLEFDFRNGPLRRTYDGLKYALKSIEDVVYEISLLDDIPFMSSSDRADEMSAKKQRLDTANPSVKMEGMDGMHITTVSAAAGDAAVDSSILDAVVVEHEELLVDVVEISAIRDRMEVYDKLREDVIKQARDVQKLSKLAIYSIHRGALKDSRSKLNQAMVFAMKIFEIVDVVRI